MVATSDATSASVSVVITNYNHGEYVTGAVRSALDQVSPATEVLVVDDGSNDGSRAVLLDLAAQEPRLRLMLQDNLGVVQARNRGLREVTTDWVVFLDSDDVLEPVFVERTLAAARSSRRRVGFVYSDARLTGAASGVLRARRFSRTALLLGNYVYNCCLMRRSAALEVGGYDPRFTDSHEDWDLFLRLVERGYAGVYVPAPLFRYRRHPEVSRNVSTAAQYASTIELIIETHPSLYGSRWSRRLVRRQLPGLALALATRRKFRPVLPTARQAHDES